MFEIGQDVRIPCSVSPGPFSDERLVTVDTVDGPISGFIRADDVVPTDEGAGLLIGKIVGFNEESVTVRLKGSFFTTNGLAAIAKDRPQAA